MLVKSRVCCPTKVERKNVSIDTGYPIKVVANKTGLSQHVIRVWEKRYDAIVPERTSTNRRLYSEEDIQKLMLLRKATLSGYNIGTVATLSVPELLNLLTAEEQGAAVGNGDAPKVPGVAAYIAACMASVSELDPVGLERKLNDALVDHGKDIVISDVMAPLMHEIGEKWRNGEVRILHEHMATEVVRQFLHHNGTKQRLNGSAPCAVVTTPAGQMHEFGALLVAEAAASDGWRVRYLGPNLPAEEIAAAAKHFAARVVCLSIVYPGDDPNLDTEISRLGRMLPDRVSVIAGGLSSKAYSRSLETIGAFTTDHIEKLRLKLGTLRAGT